MKRRILITAGGTATVWHMSNIVREYFGNCIELHVCDINPRELVAASINSDKFHRVPYITDKNYKPFMLHLLETEKIEIIIPLIDWDLFEFCSDNDELKKLKVISTGPERRTAQYLANKEMMFQFLTEYDIPTPVLVHNADVCENSKYIIKPKIGCGSKGMGVLSGAEIKNNPIDEEGYLIQELCRGEEITAEVFHSNDRLEVFQRVRIKTKEGVCTKAKYADVPEIREYIEKLVSFIPMPLAFCVQFMKCNGIWSIIDCNLRIGAGTALATTYGFQLVRAFFANLIGETVEDEWFKADSNIKAVVRVYRELAMR